MVYVISFDLNKEKDKKGYDDISDAIKDISNGYCAHYLDSTWLIKSELMAKDIFQRIKPFLDQNDECIVIEVNKNNRNGWLKDSQWKYLEKNIFDE